MFISFATVRHYEQTYLDGYKETLIGYCNRISNQVQSTGYLSQPNESLNNELNTIGELFNGRLLVIEKSHKVVYDSYALLTRKIAITSQVSMAMKGNQIVYTNDDTKQAVFYIPIVPMESKDPIGVMLFVLSTAKQHAHIQQMRENALAFSLLFLLLLTIAGWFVSRKLVIPLKNVTESLRHISDGLTNEAPAVDEYREVSVISSATNDMLTKINQLDSSRQEFVSNVSHELKTPMTSMKVLADALLTSPDVPAEMYREFLIDINNEIDRENEIISDLLTLVRMDKKASTLNLKTTQMNEILAIVMKRVKPLAEASDIEMVLESFREVTADVDEVKLIIALTNIMENAVKYNRQGGYVHISLNADLNYCYITVEDNGIGIPEESLTRIFDRFYRVDKDRSRESGGTGLGMSIAQDIVTAHKGLIKVYSREDEGTTVTIRLPLVNAKFRRESEDNEGTELK